MVVVDFTAEFEAWFASLSQTERKSVGKLIAQCAAVWGGHLSELEKNPPAALRAKRKLEAARRDDRGRKR